MDSIDMKIALSTYSGKRVLVTGHTGFKGAWLVQIFKILGANVAGYALPPSTEQSHFKSLGIQERITNVFGDIRDLEKLQQVFDDFKPEVVFHLAAQPIVRRSYNDPLGTWSTNVQGSLHVLEALKPLKHPCVVVMVTTDKVYDNQEWEYGYRECDRLGGKDPYSASKAGVLQLSRQMAVEWGPLGIRSNAICPGMIRTALSAKFYEEPGFEEKRSAVTANRRVGEPSDIANVALFLASNRSNYMNGAELVVDGGMQCMLMDMVPRPGYNQS